MDGVWCKPTDLLTLDFFLLLSSSVTHFPPSLFVVSSPSASLWQLSLLRVKAFLLAMTLLYLALSFFLSFFSPFQLNLDSRCLSCLKSFIPLHISYCMSWPVNFPRSPTEGSCESCSFLVVFCCWALKGKPPTLQGSYRAVPLAGMGNSILLGDTSAEKRLPWHHGALLPQRGDLANVLDHTCSSPFDQKCRPPSPCSSSPIWATDPAHIKKSNSRSQRHFALRSHAPNSRALQLFLCHLAPGYAKWMQISWRGN